MNKGNKTREAQEDTIMKKRTHNNHTYSNSNMYSEKEKCIAARKYPAKHSHTIILSFVLIIICSCIFGSSFSSAHENHVSEPVRNKCYKSIQVQSGESLWSIARDNMTDEYDSIDEYIDEIAVINHISTIDMDSIQEGTYLTVAYYSEI